VRRCGNELFGNNPSVPRFRRAISLTLATNLAGLSVTCKVFKRDGLPVRRSLSYSDITMDDRITIDPAICHGKPIIRGTRTPVSIVVGSLAGGMSFQEVQREYDLTMEDIRAALKFAGELVDQEQHHPLPT
jgi:uncharacterized protein (DUF433 family)